MNVITFLIGFILVCYSVFINFIYNKKIELNNKLFIWRNSLLFLGICLLISVFLNSEAEDVIYKYYLSLGVKKANCYYLLEILLNLFGLSAVLIIKKLLNISLNEIENLIYKVSSYYCLIILIYNTIMYITFINGGFGRYL